MPRRLLRPSAALSWKMAFVIFSSLSGATFATFVRSDRVATEAQARHVVQETAELITGHAANAFTQTIDGLRLLARRVGDAADVEAERQRFSEEFALFVSASEPVGTLWSVDSFGRSLMDHRTARPGAEPVTHRAYYQAHARGDELHIGISQLGTVSPRPRFTVSVRISQPDGRFAGCLVAGMNVSYFQYLYESSRRASGVDAIMVRADGGVLAAWPGENAFSYDTSWLEAANKAPVLRETDGELFKIRRIADLPVYVIARLDMTPARRAWQNRTVLALAVLLASVAMFAWLTRRGLATTAENEAAREDLERRVQARTAELKTLYEELNHRVKNNLQLVSAFVRIGGTNITDPAAALALRQTSQRIEALADVHRLLEDVALEVRVAPFCQRIVERLRDSFVSPGQTVTVRLAIPEALALSSGEAVALGVALNEIVTNAFKHAFVGRAEGTLAVSYSRVGRDHCFTVADDGIGLRPDVSKSTGSRVTDAMISKLEGLLTATSDGSGTTVTISFPVQI